MGNARRSTKKMGGFGVGLGGKGPKPPKPQRLFASGSEGPAACMSMVLRFAYGLLRLLMGSGSRNTVKV